MPLHSEVHIDRPLSNFAVEYVNAALIAEGICPVVRVGNKSDKYATFEKKDRFTIPETIRGPKDYANEVDWSVGAGNYACIDRALRDFLSDALVANCDPGIDPRRRTTEFLTDLLLLDREVAIMTLVTTYGNYGSGYRVALTGGDRWDVPATSDPLANVETAKAACFVPPNVCLMGADVWSALKQHPQILNRISGGASNSSPAMVTPQLVAELFEVDRVLIGRAKRNTANKGQTASFAYVWGKDVVLAYVAETPSLQDMSAFKTFRWNQMSTAVGYQVRSYRDEGKGGGGEWIEVETSDSIAAVCTDAAYLIDTVVS